MGVNKAHFASFFLCLTFFIASGQSRFSSQDGVVTFVSDAPLEYITATSQTLRGVIEAEKRSFAFSIDISSFQGFNSPLQRVHFNENYMESDTYPTATFAGKFIEDVDLTQNGTYEIRVKGRLKIHGIEKERIIKGTVEVSDGEMRIQSAFTVMLEDHNIRIPRVVFQKIAKVISVTVDVALSPEKS